MISKTKKITQKIIVTLAFVLAFSSIFAPINNANAAADKNTAIAESTYYSVKTNEILLNEKEALAKDPSITSQDIAEVNKFLESLTENDINQILLDNGYSLDEVKIDSDDTAHANIVWYVPVIIIALLTAGALIFTALYFKHKEKQNLINKCYANKGYPVIDSRDKAGLNGTTNSGAAKAAGGYKFECRKR